uniref:Tetraspanin n=1 Tax=Rhabditophanes sp. KR3021 TaxID=114890 RepID=A0AC35U7R7_9BILA
MVNKRKKMPKPRQEICSPLKWLCFLVGFIFLLIGLVMTCLGVYLLSTDIKAIEHFLDALINPSFLITIFGAFIVFVGTCAFWGSLRENATLLKLFSFTIFASYIIIVVFAFLVFFTFYTHPDDNISAQSILLYAIKHYHTNKNVAEIVDYVQEQFECCGATSVSQGYRDWLLNEQFVCNSTNPYPERCGVPFSCCRRSHSNDESETAQTNKLVPAMAAFHCWKNVQDKKVQDVESRINTYGCIFPLRQVFEKNAIYLGIIVSIIICPVCLAICLSHLLAKQIDHQRYLLEREARRYERYQRREARQKYNDHYAAVLQTYQLTEEDGGLREVAVPERDPNHKVSYSTNHTNPNIAKNTQPKKKSSSEMNEAIPVLSNTNNKKNPKYHHGHNAL